MTENEWYSVTKHVDIWYTPDGPGLAVYHDIKLRPPVYLDYQEWYLAPGGDSKYIPRFPVYAYCGGVLDGVKDLCLTWEEFI